MSPAETDTAAESGWRTWRRTWITRPLFAWYRTRVPPMSATEREALEAGTVWWDAELFSGRPNWDRLLSAPAYSLTPAEQAFVDGPTEELCAMLDDWRINFEFRDLPPEAWAFIRANRFFGLIIPTTYGGLGFSAQAHSAIVSKLSTRSIAAAVTVMVPNSLGPAELLLHYGTDAQKNHYLPRLARGDDIPCFALTGPEAGSDASNIPDIGIVCRGMHEGREVLGLRVTWEKRYITLGPVATVMGLAFRARDPDHLLGGAEDLGITVALVPTDTPGVEIGRRHYPAHQAFMNGPNRGRDVFIPMDWILGGQERIGQGWRMLMESLAAGRGISLPSLSAGGVKLTAFATGAYGRVRKQFGISVGKFQGVQEALARIAGRAYIVEAMRRLTTTAIDMGEHPSVITAIVKAHATNMMRDSIVDAMDVHGGKGIADGPNNYLANVYHALPVAITVEGANILTRSLIIFGQGAIRCHPYLLKEMDAARMEDRKAGLAVFDKLIWAHATHMVTTKLRAFLHNLTFGLFANAPPARRAASIYKQLMRSSATFAYVAEVAMVLLGGALKRKESLSARLGDGLSAMFMLSAALKRFEDEGQQEQDWPLLKWSADTCLYNFQEAMDGVLRNFPYWPIGPLMRIVVFPLGRHRRPPSDKLNGTCAEAISAMTDARMRLTAGTYVGNGTPLAALEQAFRQVLVADAIHARMRKAGAKDMDDARKRGLLNDAEEDALREAAVLTRDVIRVEDFAPDELSPRWNQRPSDAAE